MKSSRSLFENLSRRQFLQGSLGVAAGALLPVAALSQTPTTSLVAQPSRVKFRKVAINEASDFEAACAADVTGNGKLDIICGDTWYEAPHWTPHKFREVGVWGRDSANSGYRSDFADIPLDVTGDGKVDLVSMDYASGEIFWLENPGKVDAAWTQHSIAKPGSMETGVVAPFLGKNTVGILPNCGGQVVWYELRTPGAKPEWVEHVVGKEGAAHGLGWGDVNGDGKADIVTPHGWYENVDARNDKWVWHGDWQCDPGAVGIGMPTYDFDGDGRNDIVFGSGHGYGLFWLQQAAPGSPQKWVQHSIDTSWSQVHTLQLANLERGGHPVVLTGKRYLAHDHDAGAREPLGIFYYKFDRKQQQWQKFVIDQGTHAGTGLQMTTVDLRRSGHMDIIAPGKSGLYLFENLGL